VQATLAILDLTQKWNSTSAAGVSMLLVLAGAMAIRRDRLKTPPEKPWPRSVSATIYTSKVFAIFAHLIKDLPLAKNTA
jgi:hypothetical protein